MRTSLCTLGALMFISTTAFATGKNDRSKPEGSRPAARRADRDTREGGPFIEPREGDGIRGEGLEPETRDEDRITPFLEPEPSEGGERTETFDLRKRVASAPTADEAAQAIADRVQPAGGVAAGADAARRALTNEADKLAEPSSGDSTAVDAHKQKP